MAASGAKYGIMTSHFYWVGAMPAMVFVGLFMMPFYYGSRARSVPEYLKLRFDEKTRGLNAITFAIMTLFSSGISMYALVKLLVHVIGRLDDCGAPDAAHRGDSEDAHAAARDSAGHARDRPARVARRIPADRQRWTAELQPRHPDDAGALHAVRGAGIGTHRADGVLHVRHGRQRHGVQHGLDVRHPSVLHPPPT